MLINIPNSIKSFIGDSAIYVLVNILNKAIPFILLPIIVRLLSTEDFGKYSLFLTIEGLLIPIITLNLSAALSRHYFIKDINLKIYISTIFFGMLMISSLFFLILTLIPESIISVSGLEKYYFSFAFFTAFIGAFIAMILNLFRLQRKPLAYGFFIIFQSLFLLLVVIIFISFKPDFDTIINAKVFATIVCFIVSIILLLKIKLISFNFDNFWFKKAFKFSLPTVLYSMSAIIFISSDRFLIENFLGFELLGYYAATYQLASIISLLGMSVNAAWMPWLFENLERKDHTVNITIVKLSYSLMFMFIAIGFVFSLLYPYLARIYLPPNFHPFISLGYLFIGGFVLEAIYLVVSPYLYYVEKTIYNFYIGFFIAVFNLTINYIYIPIYGISAAAFSMFLSWLLLALLFFYSSNKNYKMPWLYFLK
jgi:O-antigen/teichoic acid export membrane protein